MILCELLNVTNDWVSIKECNEASNFLYMGFVRDLDHQKYQELLNREVKQFHADYGDGEGDFGITIYVL